jgi:hypothetical protein
MAMEYLQHLFDGRAFEIPGVDPVEYETLASEIYGQFVPQGPVECFHVDMIVYNVWSFCRLLRVQDQFQYDAAKPGVKAILDYAALRLRVLDRSYSRIVKDLDVLQRKRREHPANTPECGDLASFLHQPPTPRPRRRPAKKTATDEWIH